MMFNSEMKFENVIQKNFKIDVFAIRDRVVQLSKMRRICETRWKQALNKAKRNYNKKKNSNRIQNKWQSFFERKKHHLNQIVQEIEL
jgi:hypothetical protein